MGPLFDTTKRVIVVATKKRKNRNRHNRTSPSCTDNSPSPSPLRQQKVRRANEESKRAAGGRSRAFSLANEKTRVLWVGKERGTGVFAGGGGGGDDDIVNLLARTYLLQCETRSLTCNATVSYVFFSRDSFTTGTRRRDCRSWHFRNATASATPQKKL